MSNSTFYQLGLGGPKKYMALEDFLVNSVWHAWESGAPITSIQMQLQYVLLQHLNAMRMMKDVNKDILNNKPNTFQ